MKEQEARLHECDILKNQIRNFQMEAKMKDEENTNLMKMIQEQQLNATKLLSQPNTIRNFPAFASATEFTTGLDQFSGFESLTDFGNMNEFNALDSGIGNEFSTQFDYLNGNNLTFPYKQSNLTLGGNYEYDLESRMMQEIQSI